MAADRRRARQEALVRALDSDALGGLVVTSHANIRYLTGFSGSAAVVAVTPADVLLVTDFRYDEQARAEAGEVARIEVDSTSVWDRFFQELATLGPLGTLGYEAHALSVHDAERFAQAGKAWRWVPTTDLVERLRAAKDEVEVAAIRGAAQLAGEALRQTLVQVRPGMTELARDPIAARGFGEAFGLSLGHGLGLEVHEAPRLSKTNPDPLPADAVVTIEPGVYLAGDGGVRIEDDVHLAAAGPELLSDGLTDLFELQQVRQPGALERRADGPVGARVTLGAMNLDIIAQLAKILREAPELGAIEVRRGLFGAWSSVRVSKAGHTTNESGQHVVLAQAHAPAAAAAPGAPAGVPAAAPPSHLVEIKSPMVGTFYSAPEPGAEPYVKAGTRVATGQVVCIIEAMKIMRSEEHTSE